MAIRDGTRPMDHSSQPKLPTISTPTAGALSACVCAGDSSQIRLMNLAAARHDARSQNSARQQNHTRNRASIVLGATLLLLLTSVGCNRYPYGPGLGQYPPGQYPPVGAGVPQQAGVPAPNYGRAATGPNSVFAQQQTNPQLLDIQRRVQQLDENNRQLTSQLAQQQQQNQAFRERNDLLQRQLQDASLQYKQLLASSQQISTQARGLQASMQRRGGARLTANNSVSNKVANVQIAGARVIPEGDLVRIRMAADQLFAPGTAQPNPAGTMMLNQIATVLTRDFSRQRVAIEGHTDTSSSYGGTAYQLGGTQAQAIMDLLVRRGGVPARQLFVVAHGPNHPIADNNSPAGRAENRRIEVVIYPETF